MRDAAYSTSEGKRIVGSVHSKTFER